MSEFTEQELRRREELAALKEAAINPYPYAWEVDAHAGDILATFEIGRAHV